MHLKPDFGRAAFIRKKPTLFGGSLVIHNTYVDRMALCRRHITQVSALLDLDGSVLDYHVFYG